VGRTAADGLGAPRVAGSRGRARPHGPESARRGPCRLFLLCAGGESADRGRRPVEKTGGEAGLKPAPMAKAVMEAIYQKWFMRNARGPGGLLTAAFFSTALAWPGVGPAAGSIVFAPFVG